jgi:hypothetical protein
VSTTVNPLPTLTTVTGRVVVTTPTNGTLDGFNMTVEGGTCSTPTCASTSLSANQPMECTYTCSEGVTRVTPQALISGNPVTGSAVTRPAPVTVDGRSACVVLSDAVLQGLEPAAWGANKTICYNSPASAFAFDFPTRVPPPAVGTQCVACRPTYTVREVATIALAVDGSFVDDDDAVAVITCPVELQCRVTTSLNTTVARDWQWCEAQQESGQWQAAGLAAAAKRPQRPGFSSSPPHPQPPCMPPPPTPGTSLPTPSRSSPPTARSFGTCPPP